MADEKRIAELMKALDISREEAIEVLQDDDDIEHGKPKDFDLSEEKKKYILSLIPDLESEPVEQPSLLAAFLQADSKVPC